MLEVVEVKNPRHTAHQNIIDMDVCFKEFGQEWLPYSAKHGDDSGNGADLYDRAMAGEFGAIAPYVEQMKSLDELLEVAQLAIQGEKKRKRDSGVTVSGILFDTDELARLAYLEFFGMLTQDPEHTEPEWKASGTTFVEMNPALFMDVVAARKENERSAFEWQRQQLEYVHGLYDAGNYQGLLTFTV